VKKILFFVCSATLLVSCSQFSKSPTSTAWHNLNAKYNSLWIARLNYATAVDTLQLLRVEDYSKILPILPKLDSIESKKVDGKISEVIKKASNVAEKHSNSKYLGEAYLLLGKARMLREDFINASEIFKFINSEGKNESDKNAALIELMRVYIEMEDLQNANQVSNILKNKNLQGENLSNYYVTKAYYHQKSNEELVAVAILDEALKIIKKGESKARLYYIAGQVYQKYNRQDLALPRFKEVFENSPNYDLEFNSQVSILAAETSSSSTGNLSKAFEEMLNDRKNNDLKDKIYLKMGQIEEENKHPENALLNYEKSKNESKDQNGKAKAYLAMADVYYNQLQDFEKASMYYDSTLLNYKNNQPDFDKIMQKANSLAEFVRYKKVIVVEDSLQTLAKMNPVELDTKLGELVEKAENDKKKMIEDAMRITQNPDNSLANSSKSVKRWELYDPVKINQGKLAFQSAWGTRELKDDWRRSEKQGGGISFKLEKVSEEELKAEEERAKKANEIAEIKKAVELKQNKQEILDKLPTTPEKLAASLRKQEEAYYRIGKIYKLQLNENSQANETFQTLLAKFPNTGYAPEVLYFLSVMAENPSENPYRMALISSFPNSTYAKQVQRGTTEITSETEAEANKVYKEAFEYYENGNFEASLSLLNDKSGTYLGSKIEDKIALLRIYVLAKGNNKDLYKTSLDEFVSNFPTSKFKEKIMELKNSFDAYEKK
jgi:tetratricopeptide (TPR) repeat protein